MTSTPKEFRQNADDADKRAEEAKTEEMRDLWRTIADNWRSMAAQAERQGWSGVESGHDDDDDDLHRRE